MSAEEDSLFETLRIDRVQAKLAIAEAIVGLAQDGRVEHGKGIEGLARAFNLMPPTFGVGDDHHGGHGASHDHGLEHAGHSHAAHRHPHAHPHPHAEPSRGRGPAESDADGIGLATLIARASAEMAEARAGGANAGRHASGQGGGTAADGKPLVSRVGLLTVEGATQLRLAVLRAKIALAEAVAVASRRAGEPEVCSFILSLTTAFEQLPAPFIVVAETDSDE